jgi:hypothetical protein
VHTTSNTRAARLAGEHAVKGGAQPGKKRVGHGVLEILAGRQLHQHATELAAQGARFMRKLAQRRVDVTQPCLMRDAARQLDRKAKIVGNAGGPARVGLEGSSRRSRPAHGQAM